MCCCTEHTTINLPIFMFIILLNIYTKYLEWMAVLNTQSSPLPDRNCVFKIFEQISLTGRIYRKKCLLIVCSKQFNRAFILMSYRFSMVSKITETFRRRNKKVYRSPCLSYAFSVSEGWRPPFSTSLYLYPRYDFFNTFL